jgi:hypothetical protein
LDWAEIRLKRSNARSLISATDFGRINAKFDRNFSKMAEFHPNRRTKNQPWVKLDYIRPKSVAEIKMRAFDRF